MEYVEHPLIKPRTIEARLYQQVILNTAVRGNTLVVLPTGLGKCHASGDLVLLSNGEVAPIEEIVNGAIKESKLLSDESEDKLLLENDPDNRIFALDKECVLNETEIGGFYKSVAEETVKIETGSGVEIEVTPEHPLLTMEEGRPVWREARSLKNGDYVGVLRRLDFSGRRQTIDFLGSFRDLPNNNIAYAVLSDGTEMRLEDLGKERNTKIEGVFCRGGHAVPSLLRKVSRLTPELARFVGLLMAEGRISRGVMFYNEEESLLREFKHLSRKLFGLECKQVKGGLNIRCTALVHFLRNVFWMESGEHSRDKRIPPILMRSTNEDVSAFLGALFDGDGSIRKDGSIELTTASEDIANILPYLLLRLGIKARVHKKRAKATNSPVGRYRTYYRLWVEGLENVRRFCTKISLKHPKKKERVRKILSSAKSANTNTDIIPVGDVIASIRNKLRMKSCKIQDFPSFSSVDIYERGERKPSRSMLLKILKCFEKRYDSISSLKEKMEHLKEFRKLLSVPVSNILNGNVKCLLKDADVRFRQYKEWLKGKRQPRIRDGAPFLRILSEMGKRISVKEIEESVGYVKKVLRISDFELRKNNFYMFYASPSKLVALLDYIIEVWETAKSTEGEIRYLQTLAESDLMWDEIGKVEIVSDKKTVFDLQVKNHHNFIAGRFGCLPSHNTSLAVMLAAKRLTKLPESKILMMAPTRPLVMQHEQTFEQSMNLQEDAFQLLTGRIPPSNRGEIWKYVRLAFATPQIVERDLIFNRVSLGDFSLLVFDEAHRAAGDYAYTFIAERYMDLAENPLILGLTASPGGAKSRVEKIKSNLFIEQVETRTEKSPDVAPYVQPVEIERKMLELPKPLAQIKNFLEKQLKDHLRTLKDCGFLDSIQKVGKRELLKVQKGIRGEMQELSPNPPQRIYTGLMAQAAAFRLSHAIELLETQGLNSLCGYLERLEKKAKRSGSPKAVKLLIKDPRMGKVFRLAKSCKGRVDNPKLEEAHRIIREQLSKNPDSRVIVFAHYRDSAARLVECLEGVESVKPARFVGQADRGKDKGLSQTEQAKILNKFREGTINVLVSTAVGEEGLDIPNVDLALFYEAVPSGIRSIQRRGRTGRRRPGRVVALLMKGTRDEAFYWSAVHKERRMREALDERVEKESVDKTQKTLKDFGGEE